MSKASETYFLKIGTDPMQAVWTIVHGVVVVLLGPVIGAIIGGPPAGWMMIGLVAVGLGFILYGLWQGRREIPLFEADRVGFRIRGGRKYPWARYHSVIVSDRRSDGAKVGEVVHLRLRQRPIWPWVTVARLSYSDGGSAIARDIEMFYHKVLSLKAKETPLFGGVAAPVVAARGEDAALKD